MTVITWDKTGEHFFETGADHGVLYPMGDDNQYKEGVAWNGLVSVSEKPSGAEQSAQYADNIKYLNITSAEEFAATIEAFTYPKEFEICDGTASPVEGVTIGQQSRQQFGFSYRTKVGNDTKGADLGYKLHLIYNCTAAPSERSYKTINESPEAITFSWEVKTTPVSVKDFKPTASLVIDSTKVSKDAMKKIEEKLYGTETAKATLPSPDEVIALVKGTTTVSGGSVTGH